MLYFPQLMSGAVSQYPVVRHGLTRSIVNALEDGSTIRMSDGGAGRISWELAFSGLSTNEWNAIEQLFKATQGRLFAFTFLDPTGNLLSWSEDCSQAVWTVDPLLQLGAGLPDPLGGTGATSLTNTAQASQRLMQHISGPSWYQYSFSVYLKSSAPETVSLVQSAASGQTNRVCAIGAQWTRFVLSASLPAHDDGVAFGIELAPGAQADIFGLQVEPQLGAGKYKKTVDISGVYVNCRFDEDSLPLTIEAPDRYSTVVRLLSNVIAR